MAKTLIQNIGFLTISQVANYLLPLITIPYITRTVGLEKYGLIEFATTAMLYFSALVIYGFKTTATRKIAQNPTDMQHVSGVFTAVLYTRLVLFVLSAILFLVCLYFVPEFTRQARPMLAAFPIVLGWALYPDFLFQGLQKLRVVAIANFLVKALAAVLIFVLITSPEDFYLVLAINAVAQVLVGLGVLLLSFKMVNGLALQSFSLAQIVSELKEGVYIFMSHFFTRVYTFGSILFLGFLLSNKEMGLFAASMKLVIVANSFLFLPLSGALFPYLTNLYKTDNLQFNHQFKRLLILMLAVSGLAAVVMALLAPFLVQLVFGKEYAAAAPFLQIMAPVLIFTTISHFAMQQGLVVFNRDKTYLAIIVAVGLSSLLFNYVFISTYGLYGAAYVKVGIEALLALLAWMLFTQAKRTLATDQARQST